MNRLPLHIREDLLNYLPPYLLDEATCFVFGDKHPMSKKSVDVTVCTYTVGTALVKQLYQREIVDSLAFECSSTPKQITLTRNRNCELFYTISAGEELFLLKGVKLELLRKICNVVVYNFTDNFCNGEGTLSVMSTDHVNALEFDDSFNILNDNDDTQAKFEDGPAVTNLQCKLTAARYNVQQNEDLLQDYRKLRQSAAFEMFRRMHPSFSKAVFEKGCHEMAGMLRINIQRPWIQIFNNSLIIALELSHEDDVPLEDINILIQEHNIPTMVYTTKIFEATANPPYWQELKTKCVLRKSKQTAIVTMINLKELEHSVCNKIDLNGILIYKVEGKEKYLSLEKITLSAKDISGESLYLLCGSELGKRELLPILAASIKTDLVLQHIKKSAEIFSLKDLLIKIGMETFGSSDNVSVYRKSPYDRLNGVMIVIQEKVVVGPIHFAVYSRNQDQVLLLINLMQDNTDKRLLITSPHHRVEAKCTELSKYNVIPSSEKKNIDVEKVAKSLLKQISITKEYYEDCMAKMHERKNRDVDIEKVIDILACDSNSFDEFRKKLLSEISIGVDVLNESFEADVKDREVSLMIVESEEF